MNNKLFFFPLIPTNFSNCSPCEILISYLFYLCHVLYSLKGMFIHLKLPMDIGYIIVLIIIKNQLFFIVQYFELFNFAALHTCTTLQATTEYNKLLPIHGIVSHFN